MAFKMRGTKSVPALASTIGSLSSVDAVTSVGMNTRSCSCQRDTIRIFDDKRGDAPFISPIISRTYPQPAAMLGAERTTLPLETTELQSTVHIDGMRISAS